MQKIDPGGFAFENISDMTVRMELARNADFRDVSDRLRGWHGEVSDGKGNSHHVGKMSKLVWRSRPRCWRESCRQCRQELFTKLWHTPVVASHADPHLLSKCILRITAETQQ